MRKERVSLMIGLIVASSVVHAEERRPTRGERLAVEGRCAEAMPELERDLADAPAPESGRLAWRLGQCALRSQQYERAARALERAIAEDQSLEEAKLDLARARYHAGDLDGADAALRAGESLAGDALWQLYRGMVDLARGDAASAVQALQRAVDINAATFRTREDPQAVEPVASYYLGIALRAAGEEQRAREKLDQVSDSWAGTDWATQANRALGRAAGPQAWLSLGAGMEYNDNVVGLGRDTTLPDDISDEDDFRGVWEARGGVDGAWGDTAAGVSGSYRGRSHIESDLHAFDTHFPTASLWLNQTLRADTHLAARYDFGYAWVGSDPFLVSNGGRLALIHAWSARSTTELYGTMFVDDYSFAPFELDDDVPDGVGAPGDPCPAPTPQFPVCGPPGLNERNALDRDGYGSGGGLSHVEVLRIPGLPRVSPSLSGGYVFTHFESDGREWSQQAHRVFAGLGFVLPGQVGLDVEGSYTYHGFRHPTTFPDPEDLVANQQYRLRNTRRREHIFSADARLSVPLGGALSASAYYGYRDQISTADVFDRDFHIVGLLFNVTLARAL